MAKVTLNEAGRLAVLQEMRADPTIWVLGEDVARGGLWGQYRDFLDEFGPERVVSTPISESTIMGAGLGAAPVRGEPSMGPGSTLDLRTDHADGVDRGGLASLAHIRLTAESGRGRAASGMTGRTGCGPR